MRTSFAGFTLIELVTVVAIIAVVAATGLVSFTSLIGDRLEADARKITSDLSWARQTAVSSHQNYIVVFDVNNEMYTIYRGSVSINNQVKIRNLTVNLVSVVPAPAQLTFSFLQGITQTKQINLSYQGKTKQVGVFANTGYVRTQ